MNVHRRYVLKAGMGAAAALACRTAAALDLAPERVEGVGLVIHSFPNHIDADRAEGADYADPKSFLILSRAKGAAGVQVGLGARDREEVAEIRRVADRLGMFLEGIVRLPRDRADLDRFAAEIRTAADLGAAVVRTVMLSGRRYEIFATESAFRRHVEASYTQLTLAEPVVTRQGVRLAVENHKDWRVPELIGLIDRLGSQAVGVCLDTGNSIALLEDPMAVVEALAPRAFTTHLKDMGVRSDGDGFLLAEVPFGAGLLDLPRIVRVLRASRPDIRLNIEMITRDPLKVPCLADRYWATFPDLPGRDLARTLAMVRDRGAADPLPRVSELDQDARLSLEDQNVRRCLDYARERLSAQSDRPS